MRSIFRHLTSFFSTSHQDQNITYLERCFSIRISDPEPYRLALVHRSSARENDNERLELLGDAVLDLAVADYLYSGHPGLNEGELTKLKSKLISRDQLNAIGHKLGLVDGLSFIKQKDLESSLIIGNVLEAIFGAIYLDQGYTVSRRVAIDMFEKCCDLDHLAENLHDAKSLLLEWSQKNKKSIRFKVLPHGEASFRAEVYVEDKQLATGTGRSKKKAEKAAAKKALDLISPD